MKVSLIYKNRIKISILRRWRLCEVEIMSDRVRTYISSVATGEHTRKSWQVCLSDQWKICLQSKITDFILYSKSHVFSVYDWLSELTFFSFFPVICWSYLRTEISTGNKLHSRHHPLFFFFRWNHFVDVILRPHWICKVHMNEAPDVVPLVYFFVDL